MPLVTRSLAIRMPEPAGNPCCTEPYQCNYAVSHFPEASSQMIVRPSCNAIATLVVPSGVAEVAHPPGGRIPACKLICATELPLSLTLTYWPLP